MTAPELRRAQTVYVVGHSHGVPLDGLLFERAGRHFAFRTKYCPFLGPMNFFLNGELDPSMEEALAGEGLDDPALARGAVLLVFANGLESHEAERIGERDVILEGLPPTPFPSAAPREIFPGALAADLIVSRSAPLLLGLRRLSARGFRVFVHGSIPPPTDAAFFHEHPPSVHAWYRISVLFNAALAAFTSQCPEIGLIDTWSSVTTNGVRDRRFDLDGFHLNRSWARLAAETLLDRLEWGAPPPQPAPRVICDSIARVLSDDERDPFILRTRRRFALSGWQELLAIRAARLKKDIARTRERVAHAKAAAGEALACLEAQDREIHAARDSIS